MMLIRHVCYVLSYMEIKDYENGRNELKIEYAMTTPIVQTA